MRVSARLAEKRHATEGNPPARKKNGCLVKIFCKSRANTHLSLVRGDGCVGRRFFWPQPAGMWAWWNWRAGEAGKRGWRRTTGGSVEAGRGHGGLLREDGAAIGGWPRHSSRVWIAAGIIEPRRVSFRSLFHFPLLFSLAECPAWMPTPSIALIAEPPPRPTPRNANIAERAWQPSPVRRVLG